MDRLQGVAIVVSGVDPMVAGVTLDCGPTSRLGTRCPAKGGNLGSGLGHIPNRFVGVYFLVEGATSLVRRITWVVGGCNKLRSQPTA